MTLELTSEEIVTNLLISNEMLKNSVEYNYITQPEFDLGDYLSGVPVEPTKPVNIEISKYKFVDTTKDIRL